MCIEVFLGSDHPQATTEYDGRWPSIQLYELSADHEAVRTHFSKPYVYYLSGGCCSCVFRRQPQYFDLSRAPTDEEIASIQDEINNRQELFSQLRRTVQAATQSGTAELYSCWWNAANPETASYRNVRLNHFDGENFPFWERELVTVVSDSNDDFQGSFYSLRQQVTGENGVYLHSIIHDDAGQSLTIHFSHEHELRTINTTITFANVRDYLSEMIVYEEPENDEQDYPDDENFVNVDEGLSYEGLVGIYETGISATRKFHISTNLQKITFCTSLDPILSL
ncbi:MAG: hypothetical protein ABIY70_23245 [Capsulimonas sp.]|uniref:hypothetical protein n=1 Tax=Capsulimonas sp. TaxID=2494211 RepID=UPI003265065B